MGLGGGGRGNKSEGAKRGVVDIIECVVYNTEIEEMEGMRGEWAHT